MSADSSRCPRCDTPLPADAPKGLCPRCLAAIQLATETVVPGADEVAAQPPLTPEQIAPHFPQLEILVCLGRGGMGVVYKARQKSLNRFVALKLLAPERVTDARFAERFTREAHALAALNHPHIVTIYDFGQAGGFYFLLMEFVDGMNLRQLQEARRLTPEEALVIVPPLCEALQYAHEHGIVHRDIKPANLLLDKNGRVKIADFGIAKMVDQNSTIGFAESQPAGTPQYMAPEQKEHQGTDHRADIYSLGVVLYEMLTGELPADRLLPPSYKVQIDVRLDEIVMRALEKTPELRYQTAGEMRTQVQTVVVTPQRRPGAELRPSSVPARSLKVCASTLTTPAEIGTFRGQFFLGRTRGQLILDERQLTHSRAGINTVISLAAIRDLSIGQYPRSANPAGIDLISVIYDEAGERKQVLLSPMESWFGFPGTWNARIAEWHAAIREAVIAATGCAPTNTPASQLGVARGWFGMPILLAVVPFLVTGALISWLTGRGQGSFQGWPFLIPAAAFVIAFFSFLILSRGLAGWKPTIVPAVAKRKGRGLGWLIGGLILGGVALLALMVSRSLKAEREQRRAMAAVAAVQAAPQNLNSSFGPTIERTIYAPTEAKEQVFLDLDSGSFADPSADLYELLRIRFNGAISKPAEADEKIESWARMSGADLMVGTPSTASLALFGGLVTFPVSSFDRVQLDEVVADLDLAARRPGHLPSIPLVLFRTGAAGRDPIAFRTREGGEGILQVLTTTENPFGVKIRYKLVVPGATANPRETQEPVGTSEGR